MDFQLKEEILWKARDSGRVFLEDTEVQLYPDLSPATLAYRRALRPFTRQLQANKLKYSWCFPTGSQVSTPKGPFAVRDRKDLDALAEELQITPAPIQWPVPWRCTLPPWVPRTRTPDPRYRKPPDS
ncbi:Hypothetical predicted protein, partial [Pelobates cultripes]